MQKGENVGIRRQELLVRRVEQPRRADDRRDAAGKIVFGEIVRAAVGIEPRRLRQRAGGGDVAVEDAVAAMQRQAASSGSACYLPWSWGMSNTKRSPAVNDT